ncbi:hypothetical protein [Candidatus Nitrosocosmicus sp. R]
MKNVKTIWAFATTTIRHIPIIGMITAINDKLATLNPPTIADKILIIITPIKSRSPDFLSSLSVKVFAVC